VDIRGIANSVSNVINPNVSATVRVSSGYTIDPATLKQVPSYAPDAVGPVQFQALDGDDLKQLEGLNLQGALRAVFLRGQLAGVIRADSKGGDLVIVAAPAPVELRGTWLVVKVFETWQTWTKAAVCRQLA